MLRLNSIPAKHKRLWPPAFLPAMVMLASGLWGRPAAAQKPPAKQPSPQLRQLLAEGSADLSRGDAAAAEKVFRKALALDPNSIGILNDLAISLDHQGKKEEAILYYRRALRLKPVDSTTARNLARRLTWTTSSSLCTGT